jgi:hypothetical protein
MCAAFSCSTFFFFFFSASQKPEKPRTELYRCVVFYDKITSFVYSYEKVVLVERQRKEKKRKKHMNDTLWNETLDEAVGESKH